MFLDPAAGGELSDHGLVQLSPGGVVDILDASLADLELGLTQEAGQTLVLPGEALGIDQESEAFIKGDLPERRVLLLRLPGGGHGVQSKMS